MSSSDDSDGFLLLLRDGVGVISFHEFRSRDAMRDAITQLPADTEVLRIWRGRPLKLEFRQVLVIP